MVAIARSHAALAFAATAAALGSAAQHEGHAPPSPAAARTQLGASAAFDAQGRLWAVHREGGHVVLRRSEDAGRTWSAPQPVNARPEPIAADGDNRPKVAAAPSGAIHVTWTQPLAKPFTGLVRHARSIDGGRSFAEPLTVHADRQEITHRFDALAVTPQGRVFVAWIDKRVREAAPGYRGAAIYFAVSDDGGATFRGDFRVADHSCECCRIALAPGDDGTVVAMWRHVFEPNVRDHARATLHPDGRVEGFARATFDDWRLDACPHHGPSLAKDADGRLHAVWFTGAPGREGVYYGRLAEGRVEGLRRVGGEAAAHADLAIDGRRVAIAWKEFDGERTQLRALRSDDAGATWRELTLASSAGPTDQPKVLVRDGRFLAFWNARDEPLRVMPIAEASRPFDAGSLAAIRLANQGRPFVLSLWSVHCEPCAREMAVWREMQARHPGVKVVLVATDSPEEAERAEAFLRRHDPGPAERWRYAEAFDEKIRHAIDPKWRGELPRTYFHNAAHEIEAISGLPDAKWIEDWFARMARRTPP